MRGKHKSRDGFSLVELLVVIGIIALLMSVLLPALARAREEEHRVHCQANMRQVGLELVNYANQWRGWMFPPALGAGNPPANRWPVFVFDPPVYNPPILLCPSDDPDPAEEHSYILNYHLVDMQVTFSDTKMFGLSASDLIVMGEKTTSYPDYYMNQGDYNTRVEPYRHGISRGSNYLFLDQHVETLMPKVAIGSVDPWDLTAAASPGGETAQP